MRRRRQGRKRVREKEQGPRVFLDRDGYADSRGQIGNLTHDGISGNESALPPLPPPRMGNCRKRREFAVKSSRRGTKVPTLAREKEERGSRSRIDDDR